MKDWYRKTDWKRLLRCLLCVLCVLLMLQLTGWQQSLVKLIRTLLPLLFSCLIVFLFEPLVEKLPFRRGLSCTLVYFGFLALLAGIVSLIVPLFVQQGAQLIGEADRMRTIVAQSRLWEWMMTMNLDLSSMFSYGTQAALSMTRGAFDRLSFLGVSFIGAYFLALDLMPIARFAQRRLPSYQHWLLFYKTSSRVVYHYLRGVSLDLLFLFVSVSLLLMLFQVNNALLYAALLALLNLIPYLGALIGQALILLSRFFQTGQIPWLLGILLWLIQQAEANWVQPMIFKRVMNLKPIATWIAMLAGSCFFGVVGVILAPILAAVTQLAWRSYQFAKCTETVGTWESVWYNFNSFENEDEEE